MRKLVAAGFWLLSLSLSVTTGRRCIKEARTRTGKKSCEQQLRRVDKALLRAGDIPEGSWICLSLRNLILAEDKRCSCPSSWRQSKILSKRPIPRLYAQYLTRWAGTALPNLGQRTGVKNAASSQIKDSRPTHVHSQEAKKVTSVNKVKHTK